MKVIIAGSRDLEDYELLVKTIKDSGFEITEVVSGCARGIDRLGERYAEENDIPLKLYQARWDMYGRAAGPIRNKEMASYADALIVLWDGKSKGTAHMIGQAGTMGLKTHVGRTDHYPQRKNRRK